MSTPEIRPYHNDPEKRWLVCGGYRVAFGVAGDVADQVARLRRACDTMLELVGSKHVERPGDDFIEQVERQGYVEVIDCVGRPSGEPGHVLRVSLKKQEAGQ